MDYDALAKKFGGTTKATTDVDYNALAQKFGGSTDIQTSEPAPLKQDPFTSGPIGGLPVIKQINQFGVGVGTAIGKTALGIPEAALRAAGGIMKFVGGDNTMANKEADAIKNFSSKIFTEPYTESLNSTSGKVGNVTGNVLPYLYGAGEVNAATKGLPFLSKTLARTVPDLMISAAQTGGDKKSIAGTGVTSLVANALLPGGGAVPRTFAQKSTQLAKEVVPGYVADVSAGLAGQRGEDRTGKNAFIPGAGTALSTGLAVTTRGIKGIQNKFDPEVKTNKIINAREKEIFDIENNYANTRKSMAFSTDANSSSRKRIASTDVLVDAVNENGLVRTKDPGGAIDKYKALTLDGTEGIVRKNLVNEGASVQPDVVRAELESRIMRSGLEGKALKSALGGIDSEIEGLMLRANPDGTIPLEKIHDAKISTTNGINYNTEPHVKTAAKAQASAYKSIVEKTSKIEIKGPDGKIYRVEDVNKELGKYLKDIELLENLDGKRVKGGKLGKYFAQITGNTTGALVGGMFGGLPGAAIGTVVGGETASAIKGQSMSRTFGKTVGNKLPKSEILDAAKENAKFKKLKVFSKKSDYTNELPTIEAGKVPKPSKSTLPVAEGAPDVYVPPVAPKLSPKTRTLRTSDYSEPYTPKEKLPVIQAGKTPKPKKPEGPTVEYGSTPKVFTPKEKPWYKNTQGGYIKAYGGETDLTTKTLQKLEGKTTVSKQYIQDLTNQPDLKQAERDLIRDVLEGEGNTVNVNDFAKKVKAELLPLEVSSSKNAKDKLADMGIFHEQDMDGQGYFTDKDGNYLEYDELPQKAKNVLNNYSGAKYEGVTLPAELRGNVKNYSENVYQSPIKTSAGNVHFSDLANNDNYFGHTRIEDMADNKTRRVIEVQSDLYQKGGIEKAKQMAKQLSDKEFDEALAKAKKLGKTLDEFLDEKIRPLEQYNNPTAHFRMVREEIKQAAIDGKKKLQFPTGETAMKIEGLDQEQTQWWQTSGVDKSGYHRMSDNPLDIDSLKVGSVIAKEQDASRWVITETLENGKFRAVPKDTLEDFLADQDLKIADVPPDELRSWTEGVDEAFDLFGKLDKENPIYKFYEKDLQQYLKRFGGKRITDDQGVEWIELDIKPEMAKQPVTAFGKAAISPLLVGAGVTGAAAIGSKVYNDKKEKKNPLLPKQK